jgi:hypothetical protein
MWPHEPHRQRKCHGLVSRVRCYRLVIDPPLPVLSKTSSVRHRGAEYVFQDFAVLSHTNLDDVEGSRRRTFHHQASALEHSAHFVECSPVLAKPASESSRTTGEFDIGGAEDWHRLLFGDLMPCFASWLTPKRTRRFCRMIHVYPRFVDPLTQEELLPSDSFRARTRVPVLELIRDTCTRVKDRSQWPRALQRELQGLIVRTAYEGPCLRLDRFV